MSSTLPISSIVELSRYPIEDLASTSCQDLVRRCREQLNDVGACELSGFVSSEALKLLAEEANGLIDRQFHNHVVGNAYLESSEHLDLPAEHPRRMTEPTALGVIAYDQFPATSLLRQLYEWPALRRFIGEVLQLEAIYPYADPLGALNLSIMSDGDYLRWHFDQTDFVTSLSIQAAEEGGEFEFVPLIRSATQENYEQVRAILQGQRQRVVTLKNSPGSLVLFQGRYSLHRVAPIKGRRPRLMGLFAYDSQPGVVSTDHLRRIRYGRTAPY